MVTVPNNDDDYGDDDCGDDDEDDDDHGDEYDGDDDDHHHQQIGFCFRNPSSKSIQGLGFGAEYIRSLKLSPT